MRLALVSDIHGNLLALQAVLQDIQRRGVAQIINLGDSLSGPLWPRETGEFLMRQTWPQLMGNHDRQVLHFDPRSQEASDRYAAQQITPEILHWLGSLPPTLWLTPQVFLCHGTPRDDLQYFLESVDAQGARLATAAEIGERLSGIAAKLVACGHTHTARAAKTADGTLIVNPGSVGQPAYADGDPYDHKVESGSPDARYAIVEEIDGGWRANLLSVPYDHAAAAKLAYTNGRPDWGYALTHGYVASG